ncbi:MAG: hypothetical protein N2444_03345 [Methylocystis sp.]|nr:hypothetical protein [Methylocystis sp.]
MTSDAEILAFWKNCGRLKKLEVEIYRMLEIVYFWFFLVITECLADPRLIAVAFLRGVRGDSRSDGAYPINAAGFERLASMAATPVASRREAAPSSAQCVGLGTCVRTTYCCEELED